MVVTSRIKRLIFTIFLIYCVTLYFGFSLNINYYIILSALAYLQYFVVLIAVKLNIPIEKFVYFSYKSKAMKKLSSMTALKEKSL